MKNIIMIFIFAVLLSGCAATAKPVFYNGAYYMFGDSNCTEANAVSPTQVLCRDSNGRTSGYRNAMTDQQLQMYRHEKHMETLLLNTLLLEGD